ncbi:hypothetical protein KSP39_PZI021383 [Platanthera zijinensis]|uniref:DNA-directed RNA polymerase III subunit RPC9 n=1 Tax=Platanthera zijinensis TaxID=2320716 RepID=A0AAP0FW85_9ASPA
MKILKADAGMLTDFEVLDMLRSRGATSDPMGCLGAVTSSECMVYDYLIKGAACNQTRESIEDFKKRCAEFKKVNEKHKFTRAEILNIINLRPSGHAQLYSIIHDLEKRFNISNGDGSEDGCLLVLEEFLNIIHEVLPPPPEKIEDEEEEAADEEEADDAEAMVEN